MWAGLAAGIAFAAATYLWTTRRSLPRRPGPSPAAAAAPRRRPKPTGWSITLRSLKVLDWPVGRFRVVSWAAAGGVGLLWAVVVQNVVAGAVMGIIGYQLPGLIAEMRASKTLDLLQRQVSVFVGTVNDALHARGATAEEALVTAAREIRSGPLYPMAHAYLRRTDAYVAFADRVRLLAQEVDLPSFSFFADLMVLRETTGVERMAMAFDLMDEKFRADERMQATVRGELSLYLWMLLVELGLILGVYPAFRVFSSHWALIHTRLGVFIVLAAVAGVVLFTGVRGFARSRVMAG